jgi:hypothetical protein
MLVFIKGASDNVGAIKADFLSRPASIAAGFYRRGLLSPQASFAAGATRLQLR